MDSFFHESLQDIEVCCVFCHGGSDGKVPLALHASHVFYSFCIFLFSEPTPI